VSPLTLWTVQSNAPYDDDVPRRRGYTDNDLAVAAKEVFWNRGYERTAIDHLQDATALSRSSLYLAFGTKRAVFDAALAEYVSSFIDPQFLPVETPQAGLPEAAGYFLSLADYFSLPESVRGCLLINSIAEFAGRDPSFSSVTVSYIDRVRHAFANALGNAVADGEMDLSQASRRTEMLTVSVLGVWLAVRSNADAAASTCSDIAEEILSWGSSTP
jgi:TetR/AcrR family transcriptional regulator, transcriptional repressor for nem operon